MDGVGRQSRCSISSRAAAMSSGVPKPLSTISAPAAASARAMPRPMPLVEPVTSATLPSSARADLSARSHDFDIHGEDLLPADASVAISLADGIRVHRRRLQRKYRLATVSMQRRYG